MNYDMYIILYIYIYRYSCTHIYIGVYYVHSTYNMCSFITMFHLIFVHIDISFTHIQEAIAHQVRWHDGWHDAWHGQRLRRCFRGALRSIAGAGRGDAAQRANAQCGGVSWLWFINHKTYTL